MKFWIWRKLSMGKQMSNGKLIRSAKWFKWSSFFNQDEKFRFRNFFPSQTEQLKLVERLRKKCEEVPKKRAGGSKWGSTIPVPLTWFDIKMLTIAKSMRFSHFHTRIAFIHLFASFFVAPSVVLFAKSIFIPPSRYFHEFLNGARSVQIK